MRCASRLTIRAGAVPAVIMLAAGLTGLASPAGAAGLATTPSPVPGSVRPTPASGTPELLAGGAKRFQQVYQLVPCGGLMYAVGDFSHIGQKGNTYNRSNIFSFKASPPYTMTSWAPKVNGPVNTIAFAGKSCGHAYIGGQFSSVNGTMARHIAEISTKTGNVNTGFVHAASNAVTTIVAAHGHLLVGGKFGQIADSKQNKFFVSLNPRTGKDDGFVHLNISGVYNYCGKGGCVRGSHTMIASQQLSHSGKLDLVEGVFKSVGGKRRQQIFMLNVAGKKATVTGWTSPQWDGSAGNLPGGYPYQCIISLSFYIRAAAWSPNDSTVYIADTGKKPWNMKGPGGLCDSVAAFPAAQKRVKAKWVEHSGCDSYYSVAADTATVYAAGHPRWANNNHGCNHGSKGAVVDKGLQGFHKLTGKVETGSGGKPVYTMSRANASYMVITHGGLWIASSDRYGAQMCGRALHHAGICFLPYPHR